MEAEVDVTLIDATLALTPRERLEQNDRVLQMIEELREGFARADEAARKAGHRATLSSSSAGSTRAEDQLVLPVLEETLRRGRGT